MKAVNDMLEKVATLKGSIPSYERPSGDHPDPETNEHHMALIFDHAAFVHVAFPFAIGKASGPYLWDVSGRKYIDFLSSYCCANQGHNHPKILEALTTQAKTLAVNSLVAAHNVLGPACKHLTERLGYDKILFMNSGAEAVDSAILTARRWAYIKKKVPDGKATILFPKNCYWGMNIVSRSGEDEELFRSKAGPLATEALCFDFVGFDDVEALEAKFKANSNICAYLFEPVQGEAGNIHPTVGYYTRVRELCTKYNVLMIVDEVQSGMGRTGKLFTCQWENVKADIVTLGKSLGGDFMPVSAVLADNEVMNVWVGGLHKSTYAANSLACAVAVASVDVLLDENLVERAEKLGKIIEEEFSTYNYSFILKKHCGKGLYTSIQLKDHLTCMTICKDMLERGILVMPSTGAHLKLMPTLCISEEDLREGLRILREALNDFDKKGKLGLII